MQVFKLCMKIYKKNIKLISIYFVVFFFVSYMMMSNISTQQPSAFEESKRPLAWVSNETSPLLEGLKKSLENQAEIIAFDADVDLLQDALYFGRVEYVIQVADGFSEAFEGAYPMGSNPAVTAGPKLTVTAVPGSTSKVYLEMAIDQYLNRVADYRMLLGAGATSADAVAYALEDLSFEIGVKTNATGLEGAGASSEEASASGGPQKLIHYVFNYLAYTLMFVMILGVSTIMIVFNHPDLKRRNNCSPLPAKRVHRELFLANGVFALITFAALVLFSMAFSYKEVWHVNTYFYVLNAFVFTISVLSISFLIGNFAKSREAINAIANTFALGACFLSGVFVPQLLLGKSVLTIASFFPTYWFVLVNNRIAQSTQLSSEQVGAIFRGMGIELAFAVAFFALALALRSNPRGRLQKPAGQPKTSIE